jgi:hypothetical protein
VRRVEGHQVLGDGRHPLCLDLRDPLLMVFLTRGGTPGLGRPSLFGDMPYSAAISRSTESGMLAVAGGYE